MSRVWQYFSEVFIEGKKYGKCTDENCPALKGGSSKSIIGCPDNTTSALWKHLKTHHKKEAMEEAKVALKKKESDKAAALEKFQFQAKLNPPITSEFKKVGPKYKKSHPAQKAFDKDFTDLLVYEGLPFRVSNSQFFRKMVNNLDPKVVVKDRKTYAKKIRKKGKFIKKKIRQTIKSKVSVGLGICADGWKSRAGDEYIGVTALFIDQDWRLVRITTACRPFEERCTGSNIQEVLKEEVKALRLPDAVKVHMVTDAASNMQAARRIDDVSSTNCCNHQLQLVIEDSGKDDLNEGIKKSVAAGARLSKFAHKSGPFHIKMKQYCKRHGHKYTKLKSISKVRWNSTYSMIKRLNEHRVCIQDMERNNAVEDMPDIEMAEWRMLKVTQEVLAPFEDVTKVWESETEPTMSRVGEQVFVLSKKLEASIEKERDRFSRSAEVLEGPALRYAESLLHHLRRRFPQCGMSSDLPAWGNILNPRLKGIVLHEAGEDMHKRAVDNLESFIKNLPTTAEDESTDEDLTLEESTTESPIEELKRMHGVEVDEEGNKSDFKKEMILYKKLKEPKSDQEVLSFWKENEQILPLLASAARYVLAVPCASSSVEREFSIGGLFVTKLRGLLGTKTVETVVLIRSNKGKVDMTEFEKEETSDGESGEEDNSEEEDSEEENSEEENSEEAVVEGEVINIDVIEEEGPTEVNKMGSRKRGGGKESSSTDPKQKKRSESNPLSRFLLPTSRPKVNVTSFKHTCIFFVPPGHSSPASLTGLPTGFYKQLRSG